jgi:predicted PurR-regulated permease PerM
MLNFTDGQNKVVSAGLTVLAYTVVLAFVAIVFKVIVSVLAFASPAIVPLVLGFFLALFFKPYYNWWKELLHNPTLSLLVMLATVFVPVGLLLWYAGSVLLDQLSNLLRQGPQLLTQVLEWFRATFPNLHALMHELGIPYDNVSELYSKYGVSALKAGSGFLRCLSGALSVLVALIFFVFFLMTKDRRGSEIVRQLAFLKDDTKNFIAEQFDVFVDILVSFFQRQTVICLIEGVLYGTGFWIVGLPYGFLVGFALGVMNLIPFFGSIVCLPVALPLAYFAQGGSLTRLSLVLCVWLCGQFLDGYFITPKIQGDKTGLGYAGVIFSFFFWATVLGPLLGMLLAIPLSAFCTVLWRALKAKYIKPVV